MIQKDKIKLIHSKYNEETGISEVVLSTDIGTFVGRAALSPQEEFPSKFAGCKIAEGRALLRYYREKLKMVRSAVRELNRFVNQVNYSGTINEKACWKYYNDQASKRIAELGVEVYRLSEAAAKIQGSVRQLILDRDKTLNKIHALRTKRLSRQNADGLIVDFSSTTEE